MFHYDRRLNDNEEVKRLVVDTWKKYRNAPIREKIAKVGGAISAWSPERRVNSKLLIGKKKQELDAALTSPSNDVVLIQRINSELAKAYTARRLIGGREAV